MAKTATTHSNMRKFRKDIEQEKRAARKGAIIFVIILFILVLMRIFT